MRTGITKVLCAVSAVALLAGGMPFPEAAAQAFPSKLIRIIVPFPPGNTGDTQSRLMLPTLIKRLGKPLIVENRPGASGMVGLDLVAKATPDGHTIGTAMSGNLCLLPHISKGITYDTLKDFAPIALATTNYQPLYTGLQQPFKTLPEMVAYAKANPGKLTMGTNGAGSFPHLSFERLARMAGFTYTHVGYKGPAEVQTAILNGELQVAMAGAGPVVPLVRGGKVNLLAVTSKKRVASFPDKPTANEFIPGYEAPGWFGFVAPAGTPPEIVNRLNAEINHAMKLPEVEEKMVASEMVVVTESPRYFGELIRSDYEMFGRLIREMGFKPF